MNGRKTLMVAVIAFAAIGYATIASIGNVFGAGDHGEQKSDDHGKSEAGHESAAEPAGHDKAGDKHAKEGPGTADDHGKSEAGDKHDEAGDEHGKEESQGAAGVVVLTEAQIKLAEITTTTASVGHVPIALKLTGEVTLNQNFATHIVPRLTGVVTAVHADLGAHVKKGSVMAVIDSRELAEIRAAYLTARERTRLAQTKFKREKTLWAKRISPRQDLLDAKATLAETRFEQRAAAQQLKALGFTEAQIDRLGTKPGESYTEYRIVAPFSGTVIEKHFAIGEFLKEAELIYKIADLQNVWVIASVYQKDIPNIRLGQKAYVTLDIYPDRKFSGDVTWIADVLDRRSRTLKIRVVVDNKDRLLKPGMFADVVLTGEGEDGVLVIPPSAIQRQKNETVVFVEKSKGRFERREVKLGRRSPTAVEVTAGIQIGEKIVTEGSFILKSELEKGGFGSGHGH